jgi:GntR family transcriptional regulator/MocR family aminotransferase
VHAWFLSTSNQGALEQTNSQADGFSSDLLLDDLRVASAGKTLRLTQELRAAILGGRLLAGARLPPSRVLADELGISRSVVVKAYSDLVADGYLEARQGAGTRVRARPGAPPTATALRDAPAPLVETAAPIRLLGGLPDPQLFPRTAWARHYRAALATIPDAQLGYPDHGGTRELRGALAAYLGRVRGVTTDAAHVLVCAGVTQGVALICRALHRGGARRIAVEDPCFAPHRQAIAMTGLQPVPIAVDPARGLDAAQLAEHDVAAVLLAPAHSFPTGATLGADRRDALLAWARRADGLIIEDDYDAELRYDRTPIAALQGHAPDHVAYLGSASKTFTPALRLGWIAAPSHLIAELRHEKRLDDLGSSLLDQLAFGRFLDSGDLARHLRRTRPIYRRRRDAAIYALTRILPDVTLTGAAAGLHLNIALPDGTDTPSLVVAALRRGVLLEDAAPHWADPAHAAPGLVLGYGTLPQHAAVPAIAALRDALTDTRTDPRRPQ